MNYIKFTSDQWISSDHQGPPTSCIGSHACVLGMAHGRSSGSNIDSALSHHCSALTSVETSHI